MKGIQLLIIVCTLIIGCTSQPEEQANNTEQKALEFASIEEKRQFLEDIVTADQAVRNGERFAEYMLRYGKDSEPYMALVKEQWKQDSINLNKIDWYLNTYGYPKKSIVGYEAAIAPWLVLHHCTDVGIRKRYFHHIQEAYRDSAIDNVAMAMYLERTYEFTYGTRFEMQETYDADEEIIQLMERLDLD